MNDLLTFKKLLEKKRINVSVSEDGIYCFNGEKKFSLILNLYNRSLIHHTPEKLAALIQSRLGLNQRFFARNCSVSKIDKVTAENFLNLYHIMNATASGSNYGLFLKDELLAVASFSKGRKMKRLPEHLRSYELIRFCCKDGITITGGLTKLIKHFCREKSAGDIMTYIDKQFSDGSAFINAGFKIHSETEPASFLVHKISLEKVIFKNGQNYDQHLFELVHNNGNIKLVYTPDEV